MVEAGLRLSLKDNMYATMQKNLKLQRQFSEQIERTSSSIRGLGSQRANPTITANDRASGIIQSVKNTVKTVANMVATPEVGVEDRATKKVDAILQKIKEIKKTVVTPVIRLKDNATATAGKIKQRLKDLARTYAPIVKIKDLASKLISKIKNTLGGLGKKVFTPFVKLKDGASKVLSTIKTQLKTVGSMAVKPLVAIKDRATAGLGKIKSLLGSLAKGVTIAVGLAGAGATALIGGSIGQGAKLEQSMGGVETLFGSDAGAVMANANNAYKTAGLSANAYMEQVTSFSASLLQSLSGDTAKSALVADMAMVDMADNANKFGTDMGSIQNAYQGFAKQNYTMLDNLKLGYGGTQEEMARLLTDATKLTGVKYDMSNLSDVYTAIHAIQEKMGVTGTTAKEASSTFSGSFASMKASAQNLLGNLAIGGDITGSMEQLVDTATTFLFDNAIPMIGRIISALPEAIKTGISKASPKIKELGGTIVKALKDGMVSILPSSMSSMVDPLFDGIGKGIKGAVGGIKSILSGIVPVITSVISAVAPVVGNIGAMFERVAPVVKDALAGAFGNSGGLLDTFVGVLQSALPVVETVINSVAGVIKTVMPPILTMIQSLGNVFIAVMPIVSNLVTMFGQVIQAVYPVIYNVISTALNAIIPIINAFSGIIQTAMPIVSNIISVVSGVVQSVMPTISRIFTEVGAKVAEIINTVVVPVMGVLQGIFEKVSPIITSAIEIIASVLSTAWDIISPIIDLAMTVFQLLWSVLEPIINSLVDAFTWLWSVLEPIFSGIAEGIGWIADGIGTVAGWIGDGIGAIGDFLGFAYGKDRVPYDNYPAMLHQGEKVLTRNQADQYERSMSTRGVSLNNAVQAVTRDTGGSSTTSSVGVSEENQPQTVIHEYKPVFNINNPVIQKEADVDVVVEDMVKKFRKLVPNMT